MTVKPIKDHEGWFKDTTSGAINCGNADSYDKYMAAKKYESAKERQVETLQKDVSDLKYELGDIKSLLLTLVQNQNHDN